MSLELDPYSTIPTIESLLDQLDQAHARFRNGAQDHLENQVMQGRVMILFMSHIVRELLRIETARIEREADEALRIRRIDLDEMEKRLRALENPVSLPGSYPRTPIL